MPFALSNSKLKIEALKMFEFENRLELSLKVLTLMESQHDEYVKTSKVCLNRNLKKVQRFAML